MNPELRIHFLPENCTGCRRCQLACSFITSGTFNIHSAKIRISSENTVFTAFFSSDCTVCCRCVHACCYEALSVQEHRREAQ